MSKYITFILTVLTSVIISAAVTTQIIISESKQDSPFLTVDFTNLSQRLMVSMRDEITMSDVEMHPDMIELMAQSEARKLFNEVASYDPSKIVFSKSQIIYSPSGMEITSDIAKRMGLPEVTDENIKEFITGKPAEKSVKDSPVVGVR